MWPDGAGPWRHVDRWPDAAARARAVEIFQQLNALEPGAVGAEDLTPEERPFLRFDVRVTHDSVSLESDGKGSALYYWDKGRYWVIPTSD